MMTTIAASKDGGLRPEAKLSRIYLRGKPTMLKNLQRECVELGNWVTHITPLSLKTEPDKPSCGIGFVNLYRSQ
jgi:hypothetical protein